MGTSTMDEAIAALVCSLRQRAAAKGVRDGVLGAPYDPKPIAFLLGAREVRPMAIAFEGQVLSENGNVVVEYDGASQRRRQRFTIAHEVGHLALWSVSGKVRRTPARRTSQKSEIETLCNSIAAEILAPRSEVHGFWKDAPRPRSAVDTIIALSKAYDVTLQFAALRFREVCLRQIGIGLFDMKTQALIWSSGVKSASSIRAFLPEKTASGSGNYWAEFSGGVRPTPIHWQVISPGLFLVVTGSYPVTFIVSDKGV
jgi:hypothetical protein